MPVTLAYCINYLSTLFTDVYQGIATLSFDRQTHMSLFSFAFNGQHIITPAGNTVAGELLFFNGIA